MINWLNRFFVVFLRWIMIKSLIVVLVITCFLIIVSFEINILCLKNCRPVFILKTIILILIRVQLALVYWFNWLGAHISNAFIYFFILWIALLLQAHVILILLCFFLSHFILLKSVTYLTLFLLRHIFFAEILIIDD